MKLFDEKGKIFGKINVIDFLVIIVIVAALIVVGIKVFGGKQTDQGTNPDSSAVSEVPETAAQRLTYTVRVTAQPEEVAEQIAQFVNVSEGKKEQLQHGGKLVEDAYVVDFWTEPCRYNMIASGEVEMIGAAEADAAGLVDICLVVESVVKNPLTNAVGSLEVRIGKQHVLKTVHMELASGIVVACEWESIEE